MANENKNPFSGSSFFSDSPVRTVDKKTEQKTDPFVNMVETGTYAEVLKIASNPNISKEAVERIIEKFPLASQEHWELRDKLASNPNLPKDEKITQKMEFEAYGTESEQKHLTPGANKDVKDFWDVKKDAWSRRVDILTDARDANRWKDYKGNNLSATASPEELQIILGDPNTSEQDKKVLRQRIAQAKEEQARINKEKRLDREAQNRITNESEKQRQINLKNARKGIFDESEISKAISGITGGWTRLPTDKNADWFDKDWEKTVKNRQQMLSLKETSDIKQARKGIFSDKDLNLAREMVGNSVKRDVDVGYGITRDVIDYGVLNTSDKNLNIDQRRSKQYSQQLIKLKRQDEIKRARKGDFSGISIEAPDVYKSRVVKGDEEHYKTLKQLKKTDELKRARKGDFSTIEMPKDISSLSKTDKKHYEEIEKLRQQKIKKEEVQAKRKQREQKQNKDFFSNNTTAITTNKEPTTLGEGLNSSNDVLSAAKSGNADIAKGWMSKMEEMQNKVKEQDLAIRNNASLEPQESKKSSTDYNLEVIKKQPTVNQPNISKDPITDFYNDMKSNPDFRKAVL